MGLEKEKLTEIENGLIKVLGRKPTEEELRVYMRFVNPSLHLGERGWYKEFVASSLEMVKTFPHISTFADQSKEGYHPQ